MPRRIAEQTIGRLGLYRRLLERLAAEGITTICSHELARIARFTAAQVRRDIMSVAATGRPRHGYNVAELIRAIDSRLDAPAGQRVALIGVGNLGRALLAFFSGRRPKLHLVAAFDDDPEKAGRVLHGCRIHTAEQFAGVVAAEDITVAILAVPASAAQRVADRCVQAGLRGILNFAPVRLRIPDNVYVLDVDLTASLEKVAFFAGNKTEEQGLSDDT